MPTSLIQIRNILIPGLQQAILSQSLQWTKEFEACQVLNSGVWVPQAPAIISLPTAVALAAAAKIIENPIVTRRFWSGWGKKINVDITQLAPRDMVS